MEKKPVVYKKALDSLIVLNVCVLSVLLCCFSPSQEGPAGPVASSEWEETQAGQCSPGTASMWEAEAGRADVRDQFGRHDETQTQQDNKPNRTKTEPSNTLFYIPFVECETLGFHVAGRQLAHVVLQLR